ncbi:MAG: hypothetical protein V1789_02290 [PVC group bacterium]
MYEHGTNSCVCLGATAQKIIATYENFLTLAKGQNSRELLDEEILDTIAAFIDSNNPSLINRGEDKFEDIHSIS